VELDTRCANGFIDNELRARWSAPNGAEADDAGWLDFYGWRVQWIMVQSPRTRADRHPSRSAERIGCQQLLDQHDLPPPLLGCGRIKRFVIKQIEVLFCIWTLDLAYVRCDFLGRE
jgi:hypothetical protein